MTTLFEMPIPSETLDPEELVKITGCSRKADQVEWLASNGWTHHRTRAGEAVVGRLYARLKMAGINPAGLASAGWAPDMGAVR